MENIKPPQQSPDFPDAFYRVTTKGLYVKDGKVLFTYDFTNLRKPGVGELELPGGGLDFGENFADALKREIKEEMGLTATHVDEKPIYAWTTKGGPGRGMDWYWVLTLVFRVEIADVEKFTPTEECREIFFLSKEEMQAQLEKITPKIRPLVDRFDPKDFEK
jgi:8-oxo-dGTP pyrophosphatase MutT (NUDIX family)